MILWALTRLLFIAWGLCPRPTEPEVRLDDLRQFPPRCVIERNWRLSKEALKTIKVKASIGASNPDGWCLAVDDAQFIFLMWETLMMASSNAVPKDARKDELHKLRHMLGYNNYYNGCMPPPIAYWWFPSAD